MNKRKWYLIIMAFLLGISIDLPSQANTLERTDSNYLATIPDRDNNLQEARRLYELGDFAAAQDLLEKYINNLSKRPNSVATIIAKLNLALIYEKIGNFAEAEILIDDTIGNIANLEDKEQNKKLAALALNLKGQVQLSIAQPERALDTWKKTATLYQEISDIEGLTKAKINQSQALRYLGLYNEASKNLSAIKQSLDGQPASIIKTRALQSLGEVLQRLGKLEESQSILEESLKIAETNKFNQEIGNILISLGNTARLKNSSEAALEYYQKASRESYTYDIQIQGQLNQMSLFLEQGLAKKAIDLVPEVEEKLSKLPPGRSEINSRINLANSLIQYLEKNANSSESNSNIERVVNLLTTAITEARQLGDRKSEAYATGNLARLYEQNKRYAEAKQLTEKALLISQTINASELTYQWQWQLGRILLAENNKTEAIAAYSQSVKTLKLIRSDLVATTSEVQFSFKESVEPVYREFVSLLLQPGASQDDLKQARQVIEDLQLAELDNFFRDACLNVKPVEIDRVDPKAAILYPIILKDRLEVIVAIPGRPLYNYRTQLSERRLEESLSQIRRGVIDLKKSLQPLLENWHQFLIEPIENELTANEIKTIVFVPDGWLRNIPLGTLYDGKQYLVEKYSVAIAPSLQLIDPQPLARNKLQMLSAGLSEARQGFPPLPGVEAELKQIQQKIPSRTLLDPSFTESNFNKQFKAAPYEIVHLATHGNFSSKAEETFILTWDDKININELNSLLRSESKKLSPIELLVLSACQTALGDDRAALGLAGVAVRAGARSTLASLWDVNDRATTLLMTRFYQELAKSYTGQQETITKAEALRRAQQALLQNANFSHPYYWSGFVLVGNWL
jgi:CHAT domain-containing protein